jgi:hypothetical protein
MMTAPGREVVALIAWCPRTGIANVIPGWKLPERLELVALRQAGRAP